jgi:hypothetical protein
MDKIELPKGYLLEALTRWSYFPTQKDECEFIPSLHSTKFTPEVALALAETPLRKDGYDQVEFRLTRHNLSTRPLSIPHPTPYAHLCKILAENEKSITEQVDIYNNPHSLIKPTEHQCGKLIIMDYEDPIQKSERLINQSFGKRFRVQTDITNCFPSIYTHAIPWALMGLDHSKKNKAGNLWFNKIDAAYRNIRRGETQGVGIGPAASNIVSEIILTRIDETLSKKYDHYRYIDDYTCYCESHELAIQFINDLDAELRKYKLSLNTRKTNIRELPATVNSEWVIELQSRSPIGFFSTASDEIIGIKHSSLEAIKHLELAVHLNSKDPDGSIIKYATKSIINRLQIEAYEPVTHYLLNLSFIYPHLLPLLDTLFNSTHINPSDYEKHLNLIALENCRTRRSDGICWPIHYLKKLNLKVYPELRAKVIESEDCTGMLLLEGFEEHYGSSIEFITSLETDYDKDRYWLLTYQLIKWGRIKETNPSPDFEIMIAHDVSFSALDATPSKSENNLEAAKVSALFGEVFIEN